MKFQMEMGTMLLETDEKLIFVIKWPRIGRIVFTSTCVAESRTVEE